MNTKRKIQMAATAVIANGALALALLSAGPALAATCGPLQFCGTQFACQQGLVQGCIRHTPPGCTYSSSVCGGTGTPQCSNSNAPYLIICIYTSA